ncbi:ThiJ/PfpI family protein [Gordonia polyisoprenivorans NBRC 16320 = JCM 10675]|uniref:DJ-1/PfpI family protein n=1 Tax=Gordonia polyisoprenivorans TaxID=84595 RepID=A0A846WW27_9ACTN|nr:DJ-1/PfpI family protein [Gordonia polyisoprenivorans]NKY05247.1 DJ-1/PfpI family protein [Gordonia polyisoprenivorans]GAB25052.1 ThiJ/PfpI family protein [Gordonia polyisoprenivorans NBRC 16320 = JCM 10675]
MTRIAIVVYPQFTALDFVGPYEVLRMLPDAEVRFVWHEPGPIVADSGVLLVGATHSLAETPNPDVVLVPGGPGCAKAARDERLLAWLADVSTTASWMTSVCTGSVVLAAAGLLEGRRATSHWSALAALSMFGATPVSDERVVRASAASGEGDGASAASGEGDGASAASGEGDGAKVVTGEGDGAKVVTAAGVSAGIDLALWLAGQIAGEERAKAIQLVIEYDPQPPFDSGHRSKASASTVARGAALLSRDALRPSPLTAATALSWDRSLRRFRRGDRRAGGHMLSRASSFAIDRFGAIWR